MGKYILSVKMKELTKKQIFDLQFKWNLPKYFRQKDKWWEKPSDWDFLCSYDKILTEDFIREYKDFVNWKRLSIDHKMSEDFIREFKDKVDWDCAYKYQHQKLSQEFIDEMKKEGYIK